MFVVVAVVVVAVVVVVAGVAMIYEVAFSSDSFDDSCGNNLPLEWASGRRFPLIFCSGLIVDSAAWGKVGEGGGAARAIH